MGEKFLWGVAVGMLLVVLIYLCVTGAVKVGG